MLDEAEVQDFECNEHYESRPRHRKTQKLIFIATEVLFISLTNQNKLY